MRDFYNESGSSISFEKFELAASGIVFLKKVIAYIEAEISATYEEYEVDRDIEVIYSLKPYIRMIGGDVYDSEDVNVDSSFRAEIDVFVFLNEQIQYTAFLDGTKKFITAQGEFSTNLAGFRNFLYILLYIAKVKLEDEEISINFLAGLDTNEILQ